MTDTRDVRSDALEVERLSRLLAGSEAELRTTRAEVELLRERVLRQIDNAYESQRIGKIDQAEAWRVVADALDQSDITCPMSERETSG